MASIIINGPSSHTFNATVDDVITARAEVANTGDTKGYARMLIEGSPSGAGGLTPIPANSTVTVVATANLQTLHAGQSQTLTARLYEMTANNEVVRPLGEHSQAVAQIAALKAPPKKAGAKPDVKVWNPFTGEWKMIPANQLEAHIKAGWVTEEPTLKTKEVIGKPEMVTMYNRLGVAVQIEADLRDTYLSLGYTMDPVEVIEKIINGKPVAPLIDAFDSVNLTELEELREGGFFTEGVQVLRDTVSLTEIEELTEGAFFTEGVRTTTEVEKEEEITYSWDDIYITPAPLPITYSWDDIYSTPAADPPEVAFELPQIYVPQVDEDTRYFEYYAAPVLSPWEQVHLEAEQASPYYGVTREDVLAGIFGDKEEVVEEAFEYGGYQAPVVFEYGGYQAPVVVEAFELPQIYQEPAFELPQIWTPEPEPIWEPEPVVFDAPVVYEEDFGFVWLDPTPTTYEVDYWYGEG